ncbi:FAD-binding oxidoreductase [Pontibaca methylaminivorans]|uniref:FAD/FMN-containing dehydrogenase n=1 Tax=Pontibaca methylaminivorans TaxID=515897 RepID=A0A1R3WLP0_9RHOB|nr:FAD-binding oxidoreductase [Pontibaca methylaminivorans]SIT78827.1 FAD/FMN-containing dehydrogenase [Pontibaca methylaminivorans]
MTLRDADRDFADALRARLPRLDLRPAEGAILEEPRGRFHGRGGLVARPRESGEVAAIIAAAAQARVGVVPYGGGTGLVGGQVKPDAPAPLILSLERMNRIRRVCPLENVLIAEAGVILDDLRAAAAAAQRLFPLSLASGGSARLGGILSTNAGGVNVLRYGNARDLCLGLEAVLPDGRVWNGLSRLRKDNTGYDLRGLLIGAEGTLGVITAATLKLAPIPSGQGTALLVVASPEAALDLLGLARERLGEGVSAFELIHRQSLAFLAETLPDLRQPIAPPPEWSVLVDLGLAAGHDPQLALEDLFAAAQARGLVSDGVIARSEAQRAGLWALREAIPEANRRIGSISSHDISLPLGAVAGFIAAAPARIGRPGAYRINCFGHLGDGNLHYNVFPPPGHVRAEYDSRREEIMHAVHDLVHEMGGSISAEHGIGRLKVRELERYGDPVRLDAMRAIKAALDPMGIMNPGAVLR